MLGIPFLTAATKSRSQSEGKLSKSSVKETIRDAKNALNMQQPSRAHSLVASWLDESDCPAEVRLIAGRAPVSYTHLRAHET